MKASPILLLVVTGTLGCLHARDTAVPLYPNAKAAPLPRSQTARVDGPLATIDGHDVRGRGGVFDLLPGCHVVEVDPRARPTFAHSSRLAWSVYFPRTVYVVHMKPGAEYIIRVEYQSQPWLGHLPGRIEVLAHEQDASGVMTALAPARSDVDVRACAIGDGMLRTALKDA
jgi:hypothetical protein